MMSRGVSKFLPVLALFMVLVSNSAKSEDSGSIDLTIQQLCPYVEKSPAGGFAPVRDHHPKQMNDLMRDLLSRVVAHAPGAALGYYQFGVAYGLLASLAGLAMWDVGLSVGNYMRPERLAPASPESGYLVDALGSVYQGAYGIAAAGDGLTAALTIPALFALKYLTRSQTLHTADIASDQNRKVLQYTPANRLIRQADQHGGRVRLCSGKEVLGHSLGASAIRLTDEHQQEDAALMADVYPWLNACRDIQNQDDLTKRQCKHILSVYKTWDLFVEPTYRSRFAQPHGRSDMKVRALVNPMRGLQMSVLGSMETFDSNAWNDAVIADSDEAVGDWKLVEFSDVDSFPLVSEVSADNFQYFITVAGRGRYYLLLDASLQSASSRGQMTDTLVYLSPLGEPRGGTSAVTLPIEFDRREDMLAFIDSLTDVFGKKHRQALLFRIAPVDNQQSFSEPVVY